MLRPCAICSCSPYMYTTSMHKLQMCMYVSMYVSTYPHTSDVLAIPSRTSRASPDSAGFFETQKAWWFTVCLLHFWIYTLYIYMLLAFCCFNFLNVGSHASCGCHGIKLGNNQWLFGPWAARYAEMPEGSDSWGEAKSQSPNQQNLARVCFEGTRVQMHSTCRTNPLKM